MGSLAGPLAMALGGDLTLPSDWPARLRALVYQQFKLSNWAIPTANAIAAGRGELQALFLAMLSLWSIDPITDGTDIDQPGHGVGRGVQLDRIGRLVGQSRGAATDDEYRPILRARIRANKSNGSPDSVINVFLAMFAGAGAPLYTPGWIAQYTLRLVGVIMDPLVVTAALGLLRAATQGGTRAVLEWSTVADAAAFTWGGTAQQGWGDTTNMAAGGALSGAAAAT